MPDALWYRELRRLLAHHYGDDAAPPKVETTEAEVINSDPVPKPRGASRGGRGPAKPPPGRNPRGRGAGGVMIPNEPRAGDEAT